MFNFRQDFIRFAVQKQVLRFGEFQTKAGRMSPYFFNAGLFNDGDSMRNLSQFYAQAILTSEIPFDMIYGPAYKGIPLAAGTAIALSEQGRNVPFATIARKPRITARAARRWAPSCRGAC
jgi:orotate phosphoribosyltransferase